MADRTLQILPGGQSSAPFTYTVPGSTAFTLMALRATFDGTGAAGAFLPCVQLLSDAGVLMAETVGSSVAAGGSADASFFPLVRRPIIQVGGVTYAQQIILLKSSYTCVAEWRLSEGATPWADTSGFNPGTPATMARQVRTVAMTQNYASGPLAEAGTGPSVAFNFDGTNLTSSGDFLTDTLVDASRYYFSGTAPFTVIAWVIPGAGVNTHEGPLISTVHVTSFGQPGARDDGWQLNVSQPNLIPKFQRYSNVQSGGSPDTVSSSALPTNKWTMLAGTYDSTTMRMYVNGSLAASGASSASIGGTANNAKLGLGTLGQGNLSTWYFGGLSQVSIWSAVFTATDIANLYAAASV